MMNHVLENTYIEAMHTQISIAREKMKAVPSEGKRPMDQCEEQAALLAAESLIMAVDLSLRTRGFSFENRDALKDAMTVLDELNDCICKEYG